MTTNTTFQVGATYAAGRGDYILIYTVLSRTAKFITLEDKYGDTVRVGCKVSGTREIAFPDGTYSMAPVLVADRIAA